LAMDEDEFEEEISRPYEPAPRPAALAPPPAATEILPPAAPFTAELPPPAGRVGAVRLEEAVATALAEFRLANDEIATTRIEVARVVVEPALPAIPSLEPPRPEGAPAEAERPAGKGRGKPGSARKSKPAKATKPKKAPE